MNGVYNQMDSGQTVVVLLATYNGEKYIGKQIDSIINQSYKNIKIIISDDGSNDRTYSIIKEYEKRIDSIKVIKNEKPGSARSNFNNLIRYALNNCSEKYFMFSDQDDVWHRNKVEAEISMIHKIERKSKITEEILVYSNYQVVNSVTNLSVPAYKNKIGNTVFTKLIMQTWPMGCTMILNRFLLVDAGECPKEVPNHDEWIALVASVNGRIGYLHECTVDHILHDTNVTSRVDTKRIDKRIIRTLKRINNAKVYISNKIKLSYILMEKAKSKKNSYQLIEKYRELLFAPLIKSLIMMRRYNFHTINILEDIIFLLIKRKYKKSK